LWPTTDTGLVRRLHRISAPTLLMRGALDAVLPASYLPRIADGIRGPTELATVPAAGHLADLDAAREVAGRILGFLC
jgi:pimeloyl-ACP methyl ester carboxylesterase